MEEEVFASGVACQRVAGDGLQSGAGENPYPHSYLSSDGSSQSNGDSYLSSNSCCQSNGDSYPRSNGCCHPNGDSYPSSNPSSYCHACLGDSG